MGSDLLLRVRDLHVTFSGDRGETRAVRGIDFSIGRREVVAIVGESGSGKSATALALTRLHAGNASARIRGSVEFEGHDLLAMPERHLRRLRGGRIAYVFQEPASSLNPVFTIGAQVREAIRLHQPQTRNTRQAAIDALESVGIREAEARLSAYPGEFSGGMLQRVMIAMALAGEPSLLVADEPTTALDVTIQKQIMDLFARLRAERDLAILLITHNFGIVRGFADRIVVMLQGKIVEEGPTERILEAPEHPYTQALIDCIPRLGDKRHRLTTIEPSARQAE